MKCGKCEKIIEEKDGVRIPRTEGSKSTIARYPTILVCKECSLVHKASAPLIPSIDSLGIKITKICNKCGLEFEIIIGSKVNGFYGITQQKCPYCYITNDLWIMIEKVK